MLEQSRRLGNLADISEVISIQQQAVQLTPEGHPDMSVLLSSLGSSFGRSLRHLESHLSIPARRFQFSPNTHSCIPMMLNNLGVFFQSRFERTEDLSDISESMSFKERCPIHSRRPP